MGIKNLLTILKTYIPEAISPIKLNDIKNKIVGIDANLILYQFIIALQKIKENENIHILAILLKSLSYLKMNIIPVYVFDNKASKLKSNIINIRNKIKLDAIEKLKKKDINEIEQLKLLKRTVRITYKEILEIIEILELLGIPYIIAPEEADTQLAYMSNNKIIDYVITEDLDLLPFKAKNIIKNFGKKDMFIINSNIIFKKIKYSEFVDLCILLGCDYIDKIKGIGYKTAWKLINKYHSIDNIIKENKYVIPSNYEYKTVRSYFYNPKHIQISSIIKLTKVDIIKLENILINKYKFKIDYVNTIIKRINYIFHNNL